MDEGRGLGRVAGLEAGSAQMCAPDALELPNVVGIDRRQRRVTLIEQIAAMRQPPLLRQGEQLIRSESGRYRGGGWRGAALGDRLRLSLRDACEQRYAEDEIRGSAGARRLMDPEMCHAGSAGSKHLTRSDSTANLGHLASRGYTAAERRNKT